VPFATAGGGLLGKGSLVADIGIYGTLFFEALSLVLIPIARRLQGDLLNELVLRHVMAEAIHGFSVPGSRPSKAMKVLEWVTRVEGRRGVILYVLLLADQVATYRLLFLSDMKPTWQTSLAQPETLFYALRVGSEQPNLAGIWQTLVHGPMTMYLGLLIVRLFVVFASLCAELARSESLSVDPTHPDGTGGLQPIGQVALFHSLLAFTLGVCLAAMTANELVVNLVLQPQGSQLSTNLGILLAGWAVYLLVGSALFFLPQLPLRARMGSAKRRYLIKVIGLQSTAERKHQEELGRAEFRPDTLQGLVALDQLVRSASDMAVWPFDKTTFVRYAGLVVSPLAPLFGAQLPRLLEWVRPYLGLT
jgi:hypothetical protein